MPIEAGSPRQPDSGKPAVWIAVYTRKSNDENLTGEVTSLDNQKAACRAYIQIQREKGWREFPEAFDDPAESGKSLKRPAMQRLLQRIQEGKVQGVMVYKLDRMTRNSRDFHQLLELFEKYNVAFVSATESIDTKSPQGRLMTAIMVQFAQYDRELDQERSKDFHLARARKGLWCGGIPPLGYDLKDKQLVVNEVEAPIVRRIFELYLKRPSVLRVAEELNRLGLRRKTHKTLDGRLYGGKPFDIDSVIRILRRKVYIGFITNERTGQEFPGQHPPLIAPADFEKAQKIMDEHNQREAGQVLYPAANKHGFLLRGLVRCGHCGGAVVSYVRPKNGKDYLYYKCLAQQNGLPIPCAFKSMPARKLEEYVVEKLATIGWDRPFLDETVRKVDGRAKNGTAPLAAERRSNEERLRGLQTEVQNLINLAKSGGSNPDVAAEIARLQAAKAALEARQAELEAAIAHRRGAVYDADVMAGMLKRFARFVGRVPLEMRVRVVRLLIKRVTVWKEKIEVETYETAAKDLQNAINGGGSSGEKFKSGRSQTPRIKNHRCPGLDADGSGTAVGELRVNWRGRKVGNPSGIVRPPVPTVEETTYIPPIYLSEVVVWGRIANGERVIAEQAEAPTPGAVGVEDGQEGAKFPSRRLCGRSDGNSRPLSAVIDELLFEGSRTMKGLVREVRRRASSACNGKNVAANVRARVYWLKKKGSAVRVDEAGRLQALGAPATPLNPSGLP